MKFAWKEGGKARRTSTQSAFWTRFEASTFAVFVRIVRARTNLVGKTLCKLTYVMHVIYKLLVSFTQRLTEYAAQYNALIL